MRVRLRAGTTLALLAAARLGVAAPPALCQESVLGTVSFPNGGSPGAQEPFLRGLALLHSFEYGDARASFRDARAIDPDFVMATWGEAMTWNHSLWFEQEADSARAALGRLAPSAAARAAKAPSDRERAWLGAVETLYGPGDKEARDDAYEQAMAALHAAWPDDPEAAAFHALAILGSAHEGRDHARYMRAASIVEEVFRDHPDHPGAAHYLIHSYDDPVHAPLGLRAARAYGTIAPGAAHAQHMTSHIFLALGLWDDVVRANEVADSVVDLRRAGRNLGPSSCGHYNEWLLYGYLQQDRPDAALALLAECHVQARERGGATAFSFSMMRSMYLVDTEAFEGPAGTMTADFGGMPMAELTGAWLLGLAAARRGDARGLREARDEVRTLRPEAEAALRARGITEEAYVRRAGLLEAQLEGLARLVEGRTDEGLARLGAVAAEESALPAAFGPPVIDKPSNELLGEALLAAGRPEPAARAFEVALRLAPGRLRSLRGLAQARASGPTAVSAGP